MDEKMLMAATRNMRVLIILSSLLEEFYGFFSLLGEKLGQKICE